MQNTNGGDILGLFQEGGKKMKTIGLIGGMSWESTTTYYQIINETVKEVLGGLHSAKCILYSVDFDEIEVCQAKGDWQKSGEILSDAAKALERAGADFIVICTNTMHKVAPEIQAATALPILHIAEMTAQALKKQNITKVGLLGTKYTMQQDFYKQVIKAHDIEVVVPDEQDMLEINRIIYEELCKGEIKEASRKTYLEVMEKLKAQGAQGIILGCTEIGLLVKQMDTSIPLFDTTIIHAKSAAMQAIYDTIE